MASEDPACTVTSAVKAELEKMDTEVTKSPQKEKSEKSQESPDKENAQSEKSGDNSEGKGEQTVAEESINTKLEPGENSEEKDKKEGDANREIKGEGDEADGEGESSEDEYVVERIVKKRIVDGKVEYWIKWKDWPASTNTWEPEEHLHCPDKVVEFEAKQEVNKSASAKKKNKENALSRSETGYGFERGLEAESILAATDKGGELRFVIKWKNREQPDIVLAKEANLRCPQVVIRFYEARLMWTPVDEDTACV